MVAWLRCCTGLALLALMLGLTPSLALAQETGMSAPEVPTVQAPAVEVDVAVEVPAEVAEPPTIEGVSASINDLLNTVNTLWVVIAASLVFIMNLGFGCVEAGLTRAKNTTNILFKNTVVPCLGVICFAILGFGIMFPGDSWLFDGWLGLASFGLIKDGADVGGVDYLAFFLFQSMFAATAATIVSGAVAERIKFNSFLVFTIVLVLVGYPITGAWIWGGGWLASMGFLDFAGSTAVHAVGGWGALIGAIMVGPRLGKYAKDGTSNPIPGHNLSLAMIGVFLLWWGWFGFNGGSTLSAAPKALSAILVATVLGACAGGVTAMLTSWMLQRKPDFTMALNGVLGGLVAITAGCNLFGPLEAGIVGGIGGILAVFSVIILDQKFRIDDPVGAVSVHLTNGIWGTLAIGIFGSAGIFGSGVEFKVGLTQLGIQACGVAAVGVFCVVFNLIVWSIIKAVMGMRVTDEEQIEGLDLGEHDQAAYPDFQQTYIKSYHIREA